MITALPTQTDGSQVGARYAIGRCARWILFALLLVAPSSSWAISLDDVVRLSQKGYSDELIIELIDDTGARFQLDADGLVTLKEAGVSERVIQALIQATATDPSDPIGTGDSEVTETETHGAESSGGHGHAPTVTPTAHRSTLRGGPFSSHPFEESNMGHGGSHQHYVLAVRGLSILILRSETGYRTIAERAGEVTLLLNHVMNEQRSGLFFASGEPEPAVWFRATATDPPLRILNVGRGDVIAYQRRSVGAVSKDRLAAYWAALLNDYSQLLIHRRAPRELVELHLGEALSHVYQKLSSPDEEETKSSLDRTARVLRALDHLTAEDKEHLVELATRVPAEFRTSEEAP